MASVVYSSEQRPQSHASPSPSPLIIPTRNIEVDQSQVSSLYSDGECFISQGRDKTQWHWLFILLDNFSNFILNPPPSLLILTRNIEVYQSYVSFLLSRGECFISQGGDKTQWHWLFILLDSLHNLMLPPTLPSDYTYKEYRSRLELC